jgi:hypothetical protein
MPEARSIYDNNNSVEELQDLRAKLLSFRARYMNEDLPYAGKPIAGRLGDLMQPLFAVAQLLPPEATENLEKLIEGLDTERREAEAETLAGRIVEALSSLQNELEGGRLAVDRLREELNEGVDERWHVSPQKLGHELSALGIMRTKSQGKIYIIWSPDAMRRTFARFGLAGDLSPISPFSPNRLVGAKREGEIEKQFSPISTRLPGKRGQGAGEKGETQKPSPPPKCAPEAKKGDQGDKGEHSTNSRKTLISDQVDKDRETNLREVTL